MTHLPCAARHANTPQSVACTTGVCVHYLNTIRSMHSREERLASNEVLFRKANERIQDAAEQHAIPDVPIGFYLRVR